MNILINGIGNIGTTLLNLLNDYKTHIGIQNIYALKNTGIHPWNENELDILKEKGIQICTKTGTNNTLFLDKIINTIDYIFDCNANTFGLKNKAWYDTLPNLKGASAQGSEKAFGVSYMLNINDHIIEKEKYAHIVSCNTHSLASVLTTFCGHDLSNLKEADFVVVRRSEDIGNHQRLVTANVVARHLDHTIGTHHAIDVKDLFKTINIKVPVQSSDITTPSQLMHSVRFNIEFKKSLSNSAIQNLIDNQPYISKTNKFDSNIVFELGRKYSPYGRLFSQAIIVNNNLLVDNHKIKGWAFIPQEGNTIISTIAAFLHQMKVKNKETVLEQIRKDCIRKMW